jgi:hypothetical protein
MKPMRADVGGALQFEGRTAEEAVGRARAALGESSALRCWKTRRGGVGGFFAREVFVASLTPPPGSEAKRRRASRAEPGGATAHLGGVAAPGATLGPLGAPEGLDEWDRPPNWISPDPRDESRIPEDLLSGLVEATSDHVSLRSLPIPDDAFDQVLAEAEAALARDPEGAAAPDPTPPSASTPRPEASGQPPASDDEESLTAPGRRERAPAAGSSSPEGPAPAKKAPAKAEKAPPAKRKKAPVARPVPSTAPARRTRSVRVPDLRPGLRALGVPAAYVPRGARPSLDQLAGALEGLPVAPALPTRGGAVVAVLGSGKDLARTVDLVATELALGQHDVLWCGGEVGASAGQPADHVGGEFARTERQIARRRANGRVSLVALPAEPGTPLGRAARRLLERATPDYVLAGISAHYKRADVVHFVGEARHVDALALWDLSGTRTPGELLGVFPIAFADGEASSSLGWTLALARLAMERSR